MGKSVASETRSSNSSINLGIVPPFLSPRASGTNDGQKEKEKNPKKRDECGSNRRRDAQRRVRRNAPCP